MRIGTLQLHVLLNDLQYFVRVLRVDLKILLWRQVKHHSRVTRNAQLPAQNPLFFTVHFSAPHFALQFLKAKS